MNKQIQFSGRMHQLKEQLQDVAEMELSAAQEGLRQAEGTVTEVYQRWQSALGGPVQESVLELQYRSNYASVLQRQLEQRRAQAAAAAERVRDRLAKLKTAAIETEQWGHLFVQAEQKARQEQLHRDQIEADDLAAGRFIFKQRGEGV